jgi:hypothetical protein
MKAQAGMPSEFGTSESDNVFRLSSYVSASNAMQMVSSQETTAALRLWGNAVKTAATDRDGAE